MVCDVMAARGVPFKVLFVLGLNEKVFPRYIREDAFLRDCHRRVLDATLGFKIDEKLTAYGEETLLFRLCCQAATQRLYLTYQRADESGRMLAASPYLGDARRRFGQDEQPIDVVPRRLTDRVSQRPTITRFLPPAELTQWLAMNGQDPTDLVRALGRDVDTFHHAADGARSNRRRRRDAESLRWDDWDGRISLGATHRTGSRPDATRTVCALSFPIFFRRRAAT